MLSFFAGILLAIGYVVLMPPQYEARLQMQIAKFVNSNSNSNSNTNLAEEPAALIQRLRVPTMYSPEVRESCGLGPADSGEYLNGILMINAVKGVPDSFEMRVVGPSPERVKICADALMTMVVTQQRGMINERVAARQVQLTAYQNALAEEQRMLAGLKGSGLGSFGYLAKMDQLSWLRSRIDGLQEEIELSQLYPARLVAPIYVPSNAVSPRVHISLFLGGLIGLVFGFLYARAHEQSARKQT